jgi:hypothetical protein
VVLKRKIDPYLGGLELKGNPVRVGDGHAAVIGDETCQSHYPEPVEGAKDGKGQGDLKYSRLQAIVG